MMRITTVLQIGSALCGLAVAGPAIATSDKFETLYSFGSVPNDGVGPMASLISAKGVLYGTTIYNSRQAAGTVYSIDPATGKEAIVSNFLGGAALAPVTLYKHNLFGTTSGQATIFSVDPKTKHVTNLHNFPPGGDDGSVQPNGLTEFGGTFFGTTLDGGPRGCGYVFGFNPGSGVLSILHRFTCGVDGSYPSGSLVVHKGLLYGVTELGGTAYSGIVFSVDPSSGKKHTLYSLQPSSDGYFPNSIVFQKDIIYGAVINGGVSGNGSLFAFDPTVRKYTTVFAFPGGAGGCYPVGAPVVYKGKLYGTTTGCTDTNTNRYGVLYEISLKTGEEKVLHTFSNGPDGGNPEAGLLLYQGALYGTAMDGGADGNGTVFRYTP